MPIAPSNTETYLSSDDPNVTNLMVSHYDRFVWNHNTMPLPVTLDPLVCKIIIRHLNGSNNRKLKNSHYNKIFTLLEHHYFKKR